MSYGIGEASRATGIKVPTIRYYEGVGLLPPPSRSEGKQRRYQREDIVRLNFIRHARDLGFEIGDIRELLTLSKQPDQSCDEIDVITRRHLSDVERRISQLSALRAELLRMVSECSHGRVSECRVIETLSETGRPDTRARRDGGTDPAL
ncbi:MerR family transcriptional regulator [Tardiphaga alba]|uniref:MerR family transcriptional regulator n=1 Tax=Tardiphaga alba TaxID=340268 RepID=A0ABX8A2S5_9BRAD|nr:helix-turn-helix domain-containing protein [Tardiphaga alba]QUS37844.1 MerR family transcriptional regulator [Tardiphaga alba]